MQKLTENLNLVIPRRYFPVSGKGDANYPLNAFDRALLDAGVGNVNLVRLSSIVPPHCERIEPIPLPQGSLVPIAYAKISCDEPGTKIAAGIAVAFPDDTEHAALVMEHTARASKDKVLRVVEDMARENMLYRGKSIRNLFSIAAEHTVVGVGAAFAGIVMLP